ncbi:MAG: potassium/proton antiporter [Hydrocarboniphaga effusa]|nr:potassium/proton antiporter [Hydrocarboniphaga effusa]
MAAIDFTNTILLLGSLLVLAGIVSSLAARRFGAPLLLVFLVVGMLAGEEGPGGIRFNDYGLTYLIGSLALAVILFDGGLRMRLSSFRGVFGASLALSTAGVLMTAGLTGAAAMAVLDFSLLEGLLIGSIIASTDAAAVFFLLRTGGLQLNRRVHSVLEIESGTNDPVAVFLTLALVEFIGAGQAGGGAAHVLREMGQQALLGTFAGLGGGWAVVRLLNRTRLPPGLHPLLVIASAVFIYSLAVVTGGSGFLAVYLAGLWVGNQPVRAFANIINFHDAATWLCQIVMFLMLGLLVTPSRLFDFAAPGFMIAAFLMLIGRPVAVWLCLAPFGFQQRETAFVAWVGLRGAVSIFLAVIPVLAGLPGGEIYFNVAFFVVLVSLLVQGWTLNASAQKLGVTLPHKAPRVRRVELDLPGQLDYEMVGYEVVPTSVVSRRASLPRWARLSLVVREQAVLQPEQAGRLRVGDHAYLLAPPDRVERLDRLFAPQETVAPPPAEFLFSGDVTLGEISDFYRLHVLPASRPRTLTQLFEEHYGSSVQPGDSLFLENATLEARGIRFGKVMRAGLLLETGEENVSVPQLWRRGRAWLRKKRRS